MPTSSLRLLPVVSPVSASPDELSLEKVFPQMALPVDESEGRRVEWEPFATSCISWGIAEKSS